MKAYIDSDVLIWHLRGERKALNLLKKLRDIEHLDLWIGAMQRAEVVFLMRPNEASATLLFLAQFQTAPIDLQIIDKAGAFYRKWNPRNGTDVNDAILAATVLLTGGKIYTLNSKHYPMPEVSAEPMVRMIKRLAGKTAAADTDRLSVGRGLCPGHGNKIRFTPGNCRGWIVKIRPAAMPG